MAHRRITVGVDPGASGAVALLDGPALFIHEMPRAKIVVGKTERPRVDPHATLALVQALALSEPELACLELVQGYGKQNAAAAFVFGRAYALAEMALIATGCPMQLVRPADWKKACGIPTGAEKATSVFAAKRLFPDYAHLFDSGRGLRNKDQAGGNAEAALLAYYARHHA